MKKFFLIFPIFLLLFGASISSWAEEIKGHSKLIVEIIDIHKQMTDVDKLIAGDPNNPDFISHMKKLEGDLIFKLREYNTSSGRLPAHTPPMLFTRGTNAGGFGNNRNDVQTEVCLCLW